MTISILVMAVTALVVMAVGAHRRRRELTAARADILERDRRDRILREQWADYRAKTSQEAADLRQRLSTAERRADAVSALVQRLSAVEADRIESGAGADIATVTVAFPSLPDPFDRETIARRLADEVAPRLAEPGHYKRTMHLFTETGP